MRVHSRRIWTLFPVSVLLASFAACTGSNPETSSDIPDATTTSSSSSGNLLSGDGAPDDGSVNSSSSGGASSSSGGGGEVDGAVDSGLVCTEAPTTGARVVAGCSAVLLTLFGGLPDPGDYELASVTGQGNGANCGSNPVKDKPWKGAATVVAVDDSTREVHLRLLPPDGAGDGTVETTYHVALGLDEEGHKSMRALCSSPLPVYYYGDPDGGDAGDSPAGFARALGDAGSTNFAMRLSALADPQSGTTFGIFRFIKTQ